MDEVKPEVKAKKRRSDKVLVMPAIVTAENYPTLQCMLRLNCIRKITDLALIKHIIATEKTPCVLKVANARLVKLNKEVEAVKA